MTAVITAPPPIVDSEAIGLDLFAERRQAIEADEDQIVKRFARADQLHDGLF